MESAESHHALKWEARAQHSKTMTSSFVSSASRGILRNWNSSSASLELISLLSLERHKKQLKDCGKLARNVRIHICWHLHMCTAENGRGKSRSVLKCLLFRLRLFHSSIYAAKREAAPEKHSSSSCALAFEPCCVKKTVDNKKKRNHKMNCEKWRNRTRIA